MSLTLRQAWCKVAEWCENPPWATVDNDCAANQQRPIYRYQPAQAGLNYRWWDATHGPHVDPAEWAGPADTNGHPLPTAAAPTASGVSTSTNINDSATAGAAMRYGIIDGWIWLPADALLRDNNQNTGELGMVFLAPCCSASLTEAPGANHDTNTVTADRGLMSPTPMPSGWSQVYNPQSDTSAFQGLDLEYSLDDGATWSEVAVMQASAPMVETQLIGVCDPVPDGWQLEVLRDCCPARFSAGIDEAAVQALIDAQDHTDPQPATLVPLASNDWPNGGNARTGDVGTSPDYARADHRHPIQRLAVPAFPGVTHTLSAASTVNSEAVIRSGSTEETIWYLYRVNHLHGADTGWNNFLVPTIAGYQVSMIRIDGTYRYSGQWQSDPNASVRAPYMGSEAHAYLGSRRVYIGPLRRDNAVRTWTTIHVEYARN